MLPSTLKPISCNKLLRVGAKQDGGYVISRKILDNTDTILTFGLCDEFSFEKEFSEIKKDVSIYAFDHTVNKFFWFKHFFKWFWWAIRYRKSFGRAFTFFKYKNFFNKKNISHLEKKIVPNRDIDHGSTSINQIIKKYQINPKKTLLKIDIDMDEYKILNEILEEEFMGLIIEFSYVDKMMKEVIDFVKRNKEMSIIHTHGNNFDQPHKDGNPIHLEITFINNSHLEIEEKVLSDKNYPLEGLDYPNNVMKKDIQIKFIEN